MTSVQRRNFTLPAEEAEYVDLLVASGSYASETEVIRAGLQALQDRDATIEQWLREEVVPVYDAMVADPSRGLSLEEMDAALQAHREELTRDRSR